MRSRIQKSPRRRVLGWHLCPWNRKLKKAPSLTVAPGWIYYLEPDVLTSMCEVGFHGCTSFERVKAYASMATTPGLTRAGYCHIEHRLWLCRVRLSGDLHYQWYEPWWQPPPPTPHIDKWVAREREVLWMMPLVRRTTPHWDDGSLSVTTVKALAKRCRWGPHEALNSFAARCKEAHEWPSA